MALVTDSNNVDGSVLPHMHISMVNIQTNWQVRIYSWAMKSPMEIFAVEVSIYIGHWYKRQSKPISTSQCLDFYT